MTTRFLDVQLVALTANVPEYVTAFGTVMLMEAAAPVSIIFLDASKKTLGQAQDMKAGVKVKMGDVLNEVKIISAVDQVVKIGSAAEGVDYAAPGQAVTATIAGASILTDAGPVALAANTVEPVAAYDHSRLLLVIKNTGGDLVTVGGAAVSIAGGAIVLEPGDEYTSDAPQAAHYCISASAGSVNVVTGA